MEQLTHAALSPPTPKPPIVFTRLCLKRTAGQRIIVAGGIVVEVLRHDRNGVLLAVIAPSNVRVDREEVALRIAAGEPRRIGGAA